MNPQAPYQQYPQGAPPGGQMPPYPPPHPGGQIPGHGPQGAAGPHQAVPPRTNPNSTQNTLMIAEIRDGVLIMSDGSFRSVLMMKSINFDLMSPQEREAVESAYQGFLNSLYFPVQIFIRSQKVDIRPYIEKLDRIRSEHDNMLLALLMEDYIAFMSALAQQTNIMDKKFYIIIPFFPTVEAQQLAHQSKTFLSSIFGQKQQHMVINEGDLEKAKTELRNRIQATLTGMMQAGVQGIPLDTQELIELFYDVYNPDTATRQHLQNFNDLTAPVVTKGQGQAAQPHLDKEIF
jgi:hypothetical protein